MTMSWPDARAELVELIEATGVDVFRVPPASGEALSREVSVIMLPPARRTSRRKGGKKQKVYTQRMDVVYPWTAGSEETAGLAVDAAVEAIDNALDAAVALNLTAVTAQPPDWTDAGIADYPPNSGIFYVQQSGTMEITLEFAITPEA